MKATGWSKAKVTGQVGCRVWLNIVQNRTFTGTGTSSTLLTRLSEKPQHNGKPFRSLESTESKMIA